MEHMLFTIFPPANVTPSTLISYLDIITSYNFKNLLQNKDTTNTSPEAELIGKWDRCIGITLLQVGSIKYNAFCTNYRYQWKRVPSMKISHTISRSGPNTWLFVLTLMHLSI